MPKLLGKAVNDELVQYLGPIDGRNYNTAGSAAPNPPAINVQVVGAGQIQLQETQTFVNRGNSGTNTFTTDRIPDQGSWVNLGAPVDAAAGLVSLAPTVDPVFSAVRAIVTVAGDGRAVIQSDWE